MRPDGRSPSGTRGPPTASRVAWPSQRSSRRLFALALGCAVLLFVLTLLHLPPSAAPPFDGVPTESPNVTLLVWWKPFDDPDPLPDCHAAYGIRGCALTSNRSAYDRADAVIVHHRELLRDRSALPRAPRPPRQKWIWMNLESPSHSGRLAWLDGLFNLTMSYRRDSDIFVPYGCLQPRDGEEAAPRERARRRRGLVAWVVSNWNEHHERVRVYRRLRKYIPVDVFGHGRRDVLSGGVARTVSGYKFYLAFENSAHTDYITEKLWRNALAAGAVPVVLGPSRQNYERFLPADAFIHVEDFRSPRALAAYLKHLDRHPALYQRHLTWRSRYSLHLTSLWAEPFCRACPVVQASKRLQKVVTDLAVWFES